MDAARQDENLPTLNIVAEKAALGPLRRDLVAVYQRWLNAVSLCPNTRCWLAPAAADAITGPEHPNQAPDPPATQTATTAAAPEVVGNTTYEATTSASVTLPIDATRHAVCLPSDWAQSRPLDRLRTRW